MKNKREFPNFKKHLGRYLALSLFVSLLMLVVSVVCIIFENPMMNLDFKMPELVYYLGIFISTMMLVMGIFYYRALSKVTIT